MIHMCNRLIRETPTIFVPRLRQLYLENCHETVTVEDKSVTVSRLVKTIIRVRSKKKYSEMCLQVKTLKDVCSLRTAARITNTPWTTFMRLCTPPVSNDNRSVTVAERGQIAGFFSRDDVVMRLPYRRFHKWSYMRSAKKAAYCIFEEEHLHACHLSPKMMMTWMNTAFG